MVARQLAAGVDVVKVMATGGIRTAGTDPARGVFSAAELQTVVDAAAAAGRPVAAHAHGVQGIVAAARRQAAARRWVPRRRCRLL